MKDVCEHETRPSSVESHQSVCVQSSPQTGAHAAQWSWEHHVEHHQSLYVLPATVDVLVYPTSLRTSLHVIQECDVSFLLHHCSCSTMNNQAVCVQQSKTLLVCEASWSLRQVQPMATSVEWSDQQSIVVLAPFVGKRWNDGQPNVGREASGCSQRIEWCGLLDRVNGR